VKEFSPFVSGDASMNPVMLFQIRKFPLGPIATFTVSGERFNG